VAKPVRWLMSGLALMLAVSGAVIVLTARPGDRSLWPPGADAPVVEIFVVSHGYHAGLVLPRQRTAQAAAEQARIAALELVTRFAAYPWVEVGWGDEGFYRHVPTAKSLNFGLAVRALLQPANASVLHVVGLADHPRAMFPGGEIVRIGLGGAGFERLLARFDASLARGADGRLLADLGRGLYGPSLFFRAVGDFNILNVCNHWVANLLNAGGLPTDQALATLPQGLLLDLRWRSGLHPLPSLGAASSLSGA